MAAIDLMEVEEVRQVIRDWLIAARAWDRAALERIFADDPTAIHFGTASDETYIGSAAYVRAMEQQHTATIPDMAFDFLPGSPVVQARDNVAWVVGQARISGTTPHHLHRSGERTRGRGIALWRARHGLDFRRHDARQRSAHLVKSMAGECRARSPVLPGAVGGL